MPSLRRRFQRPKHSKSSKIEEICILMYAHFFNFWTISSQNAMLLPTFLSNFGVFLKVSSVWIKNVIDLLRSESSCVSFTRPQRRMGRGLGFAVSKIPTGLSICQTGKYPGAVKRAARDESSGNSLLLTTFRAPKCRKRENTQGMVGGKIKFYYSFRALGATANPKSYRSSIGQSTANN